MKLRRDILDELQSEARRKWCEQNPTLPRGAPPPRSALVVEVDTEGVAWMKGLLRAREHDPEERTGEAAIEWAFSEFRQLLADGVAPTDALRGIAQIDLAGYEEAVLEARR